MRKRAMKQDFGWKQSADAYVHLYAAVTGKNLYV
jgi:glycogen synthase